MLFESARRCFMDDFEVWRTHSISAAVAEWVCHRLTPAAWRYSPRSAARQHALRCPSPRRLPRCPRRRCPVGTYGFLYRCPTTGHKVQGFVQGLASAPDDTSIYETVTCAACYRVHLLNPSSGHVAGTNRSAPKP